MYIDDLKLITKSSIIHAPSAVINKPTFLPSLLPSGRYTFAMVTHLQDLFPSLNIMHLF